MEISEKLWVTEVVAVDVFENDSGVRPLTGRPALLGRSEYSTRVSDSVLKGISTDNCETRDRPTSNVEEGPAGGLIGVVGFGWRMAEIVV